MNPNAARWRGVVVAGVALVLAAAAAAPAAASPRQGEPAPVFDDIVVVLADEYHDEVPREKKAMYDAILDGLRTVVRARVQVLSFDRKKENIAPRLSSARALGPAVVVALGSNALRILLGHRREFSCPIAFAGVLHPEAFLRGDRSVCGASLNVDARMQVKILHDNLEGIERIGVLYVEGSSDAQVGLARQAGAALSVEIAAEGVTTPEAALKAVDRLESAEVDLFLLLPDSLVIQEGVFHRLRQASVRRDIPIVSPSPAHLQDDAVLSFEVDYERCGRDAAVLLNRLLAGEGPEKIGVVHQQQPRIGLNLRIARAMRLSIPPRLRRLATHEIR